MRPTIYDVARQASVSPATVSKVLRGVTTVGQENASRVAKAVRDLGYRPDPLAANLRSSRRAIVGLVVPDFRNPFFGGLIAAIERLAETSGYRLVTVSSSETVETERQQIEALLDWRVAGLIIIPAATDFASAGRLKLESLPTVMLDRVLSSVQFDGVSVNDADASADMVRRFHAAGHRHLLLATSSPDLPNMRERIAGVRRAAADLPDAMAIEVLSCGADLDSATRAMSRRFAQGPQPTAIFALFIQATLAALREIAGRGLTIPQDISLAGFDDCEWMQLMHPPIATVVQPVEEMARRAWERLLWRIDNPFETHALTELECRLDMRGSIGPLHRD
jgi:DNA-binding LacI/PurR family transcriptional regulator